MLLGGTLVTDEVLVSAHRGISRADRVYEARKPKNTMCNFISFLNNIMFGKLYVTNNIRN